MSGALDRLSPLVRYTRASENAAARIIDAYSTSFGTATRLLGRRHRAHVRNIYSLVRVADELVDGATADAGMALDEQRSALDRLEEETERAIRTGYSSNPIVQAFAHTARAAGIGHELTRPFFSSMRTDLAADEHETPDASRASLPGFGDAEHARYVFGSAEVVGLMCLRVFIRDEPLDSGERAILEHGARRLGAAFQNVNFLRDLADDTARLGRSYLSEHGRIDDRVRDRWVSEIRAQLSVARAALPLLPGDARVAVDSALRLFGRLTDRIARTPADDLYEQRVRVPAAEKSWLIARSMLDAMRERAR
ncbi:phytoene/squalene synthase family protein [Microbacterium sp. No. 7]|uniref:phytoene/squalene synthase family protein n=1 Tax=Microbacterium sp. No. 7 TaxID=1714373 RepID=UPI0006D199AF|nr:squalene/phytoene synthase family protein [Microbacterium sp. No. 7]ALJ18445.1 phytoene synthase [Microbacterium sp. No. 7]